MRVAHGRVVSSYGLVWMKVETCFVVEAQEQISVRLWVVPCSSKDGTCPQAL